MARLSITTTAQQVATGDRFLDNISFKNASTTATDQLYILNTQDNSTEVSATIYSFSLTSGEARGYTRRDDGDWIVGPWRAISNNAGGVASDITPGFNQKRGRL